MSRYLTVLLMAVLCFSGGYAQVIALSGNVSDVSNHPLPGVSIQVKDKMIGTITDHHGDFKLEIHAAPPFLLEISMIGYKNQELEITTSVSELKLVMVAQVTELGEIEVRAPSRVEEEILRSPVSVERIGSPEIQNTASDDYYKSLSALKGVEMISSSINNQMINTRGFATPNNSRFVQMLDGMDMQSATLNFAFGSGNLPSSLDLDNIELLPGAASALYGPNAFNGIMLVTSKSPFKYQGLSASVKFGMNHFGNEQAAGGPDSPQPLYEAAFRYAKSFHNRLAFKINFLWAEAQDWIAQNYTDKNAAMQGDLKLDPAYDGVNLYGDDGGLNLGLLRTSQDIVNMLAAQTGLSPEIVAPYVASLPAVNVNRTGYEEHDLADHSSRNLKFNAGLNYRINDDIELSYFFSANKATSVMTAAQRYQMKNSYNQFHRFEAKASNWNIMGYASVENAGDSYIIDLTGFAINNAYLENPYWFGTYAGTFAGGLISANIAGTGSPVYNPDYINALLGDPVAASNLHYYSRQAADANRWGSGSEVFRHAFDSINSLIAPDGAGFRSNSRIYHAEGQYDFRKEIRFIGLVVGGDWRMYDLRSEGTLFSDSKDNPIRINEFGAFAEASRKLLTDHLRLSISLRYDKSKNFEGQFTPRFSAVYTFFADHNIRISYQSGFRIPSNMAQYMDMDVISARVIGGLQEFYDKYRIGEWCYTMTSVDAFTLSVINGHPDPGLLVPYTTWKPIKPEHIQVIEAGYRGRLSDKMMVDASYYYNIYDDFLTQIRVRQAQDASGNPADPTVDPAAFYGLLTGDAGNTFQIPVNYSETVKSQGITAGIDFNVYKGYYSGINYTWSSMMKKGLPDDYTNDFNTPEHMVNIYVSNSKVFKNLGFNVAWRWQDAFEWNSSFARNGKVPAYNTLDAQVSYTFKKLYTTLKIGGSNILNNRYISFYGGPTIGAIYYINLTFNQLMN